MIRPGMSGERAINKNNVLASDDAQSAAAYSTSESIPLAMVRDVAR